MATEIERGGWPLSTASWGSVLTPTSISLADTGIQFLGASPTGMLLAVNFEEGRSAIFTLRGTNNATSEDLDVPDFFSAVKNTAARINVYYDAAGASGAGYYVQNLRGATRTVRLLLIGG